MVGDGGSHGISGGQRKRVSIGMELVADPAVLMLDEPTSGLDSATSVQILRELARTARNASVAVAAVVHTPPKAAFETFDDLVLMATGGGVVYAGARLAASDYFAARGFDAAAKRCALGMGC